MGREILAVLQNGQLDRLMKRLAMPDPQTTGVILLGRGSSDAGANGELAQRWRAGFSRRTTTNSSTWPSPASPGRALETVVQRQVKLGMTQIAIVPVHLFTGVLIEASSSRSSASPQQYPQIAPSRSAHFGFDPSIFACSTRQRRQRPKARCSNATAANIANCRGEHLHDHSHTGGGRLHRSPRTAINQDHDQPFASSRRDCQHAKIPTAEDHQRPPIPPPNN